MHRSERSSQTLSGQDVVLRNADGFARRRLKAAWVWFLNDTKRFRNPLFVAIAYYLAAQVAFSIGTFSDRIFAPFWPPNTVLFCTLLLVPKRQWWLYIAATFPAHAIAEIAVGMPAAQLLVAFGTNCMVAILNAVGVRWFLKHPPWFGTLRNASIYFLITAGVGPAVSALGGAFVQILGGGGIVNYWTYWGNWYIANALSSVTLGRVFLIYFNRGSEVARWSSRRIVVVGILALSRVVVLGIVFTISLSNV